MSQQESKMSKMKDTDECAFPACNEAHTNDTMGMTLRDYFAAKMMPTAYLAYECGLNGNFDGAAKECYSMADAMIAERNQGE
jgi:hypothetical protein